MTMVLLKGGRRYWFSTKLRKKGGKPDKADWVMHQYHLGVEEKEKVGELVVSKILYQLKTKQADKPEMEIGNEESDAFTSRVSPKTPKTKTPQPCRPNNIPGKAEQNDTILQDQVSH